MASHSVASSQPARMHTQPSVALSANAFASRVESDANNLEPILSMVRRKLAVASSMPARGGAQNSARGGASALLCSSGERSVGQSAPKVGQSAAKVCGSAVCAVDGPAAAEGDERALQRVREMFFGPRPAATQPDKELSISPMDFFSPAVPSALMRVAGAMPVGALPAAAPSVAPSVAAPIAAQTAALPRRSGGRQKRGARRARQAAALADGGTLV